MLHHDVIINNKIKWEKISTNMQGRKSKKNPCPPSLSTPDRKSGQMKKIQSRINFNTLYKCFIGLDQSMEMNSI